MFKKITPIALALFVPIAALAAPPPSQASTKSNSAAVSYDEQADRAIPRRASSFFSIRSFGVLPTINLDLGYAFLLNGADSSVPVYLHSYAGYAAILTGGTHNHGGRLGASVYLYPLPRRNFYVETGLRLDIGKPLGQNLFVDPFLTATVGWRTHTRVGSRLGLFGELHVSISPATASAYLHPRVGLTISL